MAKKKPKTTSISKKRAKKAPISVKCSKCYTNLKDFTIIVEWGTSYILCRQCAAILDYCKGTGKTKRFVEDEDFPLTDVERNMIEARRLRAKGKGPWEKKSDN